MFRELPLFSRIFSPILTVNYNSVSLHVMQNLLNIERVATSVSLSLSKEDLKSFGLVNRTCNIPATRLLWEETSLRRALDLLYPIAIEQRALVRFFLAM